MSVLAREDALAAALARARLAPSADNCQPFVFHGDADRLELRWLAARAAHAIDGARYASWLTLGALLETLRLAAGEAGLRVTREALTPRAGDGQAWATLRLEEGGSWDPLAGAIEARCTDRRLYRRVTVDSNLKYELERPDGRAPRARLVLRDPPRGPTLRWLLDADAYIWRQPEVFRDISRWIRFSPGELAATGDGIGADAFGLPSQGVHLLRAPGAQRLIAGARLDRLHRAWVRALLGSASATALIATDAPGPEGLVDAGRRAALAWLRCSAEGLAVQPMTILSLPVYAAATGALPAETLPRFRTHFEAGRDVLRAAYGLGAGELPVWMFRIGGAPPRPPPRSPRRPLSELWTRETAAD